MYIDFKKFDYSQFPGLKADELVKRDKIYAKDAYKKWIEENLDDIVERQWEIEDVGVVERVGDFVKLLKEAEFTYSIGAYTSSLALVGVCAEGLCRFFASSANHSLDSMSQYDRVHTLLHMGAITQETADSFNVIRQLRNDCLHYNAGFKQKDPTELRVDSLLALNTIKRVYARIFGAIDYKTVDPLKFSEMVETIVSEATHGKHMGVSGVDNAVARARNLFAKVSGIDLSLNEGSKPVYRMSIYEVAEINAERDPFELTLIDKAIDIPVVVDITDEELENIRKKNIATGDLVAVSLMSVPNKLDMTGTWRLWSDIEKIG